MNTPTFEARELPYERDAALWARRFHDLPGFAFLDSRKRRAGVGQYDIITALPSQIHVLSDYDGKVEHWFGALQNDLGLATAGGRTRLAIGYLDYDSAATALGVPSPVLRPACAGVYHWYVLQDHQQRRCWLMSDPALSDDIRTQVDARLDSNAAIPDPAVFALHAPFQPETERSDYLSSIARIREYIAAGDCYQVNYAHRFGAQFSGDAFSAYLTLRDVAPGDFSAFLRLTDEHAVLSLSPERFLSIDGDRVSTQPIKGTRPRSADPVEDAASARALRESVKDRAENVMIVDLLRNDLGRLCEPGSVVTRELCALHSFDNVHHLVSLIEGRLRDSVSPGEALLGCSPGGSITGAPKRRAVEIIRELEPSPRGVYCGSVFALGADGWLQSSIAIRTIEAVGDTLYCWGGGGIVHDSDADAEYQETLDKVGGFMRALADS